jgi:hypothetical protein
MQILHAFLALFAGFVTMAILIGIATVALKKLLPKLVGPTDHPRVGYVAANLGYSLASAIAGGYVTAWLAENNPLIHTLALALIVLLLSALSALQQRGLQPIWYQLLLVAITPIGVLLGGLLRLKA